MKEKVPVIVEVIVRKQVEQAKDPFDNWCEAIQKNGLRCVKDAVKDGLCLNHWRMIHREDHPGSISVE